MKRLMLLIVLLVLCGCKQQQDVGLELDISHLKEKDLRQKIEELVLSEKAIGKEFFVKIDESVGLLEYKVFYIGDI